MSNKPACENRPLSILYLIYGFRVGGAESYLLDLCKGLDPQKFRPEIIYFYPEEQMLPEFREAGIPCSIFPVKGGEFTLREMWGLSRLIKKLSPDIVHVHLFHASRFGAVAAFLAGSRRIVRTKHSVRKPGSKPGKRDRVWQALNHLTISTNVAVSEAVARQIGAQHVIYNGIDTSYFDPGLVERTDHAVYPEKFGVKSGPVIGIAARLALPKGHKTLLEAFSILLPHWPNSKLIIAGDGEERDSLEALILKLNLSEHVQILGSIRNVREFLADLDIFAHPSILEGLGIAVIEAMSMERAIVATNVGGLPELITDGVDGILIEPDNPGALSEAMDRMLRQSALRQEFGENARKKAVEKFSIGTMIRKYEELYLEICR